MVGFPLFFSFNHLFIQLEQILQPLLIAGKQFLAVTSLNRQIHFVMGFPKPFRHFVGIVEFCQCFFRMSFAFIENCKNVLFESIFLSGGDFREGDRVLVQPDIEF